VNQRGYSLLLSLFAVLGVGGVWFVGVTFQRINNNVDQTFELSQAKQALISYSVNYLDHYGAQGAGIGHLPCPDTDTPEPRHSDTWHRDGPNPPCASSLIEYGWLPRHVNVREGRYHFHTRSQQRLLYAVSGQFVNNPINRVVNPSSRGEISVGNFTDVVAVLATPPLDTDLIGDSYWFDPNTLVSSGSAFTLIRTADILQRSMQRVGGWLVRQFNEAGQKRCDSIGQNPHCGFADHNLAHCDLTEEYIVLHWLNTQVKPIDCDNHEQYLRSTMTQLEGVPIQRHWYIRNKWFEFLEVSIRENCLTGAESQCRFVLLPSVAGEPLIQLQLRAVAGADQH